jgi:hypothetical protein
MYEIGTCFGCQKCLYCGINLKIETCNCQKLAKPSRKNRTDLVKNAFSRIFDPTSNPKQFEFIKSKNENFAYGFDLAKSFQFSFCTTCNSSYQRLSDKKSKSNNSASQKIHISKDVPQLECNAEIIDLEATTSEASQEIITTSDISTLYNKSKHSSETENEDNTELEIEINYKLSIKQADGTSLPAKNYSVIISELDEFLFAIQNNITTLLKNKRIDANDYNVSFKSEKAQGAGTLLVDMRDFENFKSEYTKLAAAKKVMLVSITMKKKEKQIDIKRKKKVKFNHYCFIYFLKNIHYIFSIRNLIQMVMRTMMMIQFQILVIKIKFPK